MTIKTASLEEVKRFVREKHADQVDKNGQPYLCHLSFVASMVARYGTHFEMVGWAHDLIEDCEDVTYDTLREMSWPEPVIHGIECITKVKGEDYFKYLDRVLQSPYSTVVKMADLNHNRDMTRLENPTRVDYDRTLKYDNAIIYLNTMVAKNSDKFTLLTSNSIN